MGYPSFNAGEVLTAADMNAVGLWRVRSETSFTTVSSITLPASTFTSTYKFYRITLQFTATNNGANLTFQVRSGSTTATASYYSATNRLLSSGSNSNLTSSNAASSTMITVSSTGGNNLVMELGNGFGTTGYAEWSAYGSNDAQPGAIFHGGIHAVSQNNDAAVISVSAGTITGTYSVYGYKP